MAQGLNRTGWKMIRGMPNITERYVAVFKIVIEIDNDITK